MDDAPMPDAAKSQWFSRHLTISGTAFCHRLVTGEKIQLSDI
ncbi:hypothetical protein [Roseovarius sp. CAU 1744]